MNKFIKTSRNTQLFFSMGMIAANIVIILNWYSVGLLNPSHETIIDIAGMNNEPSLCRLSRRPLQCLKDLSSEFVVSNIWIDGQITQEQTDAILESVSNCSKLSGDLLSLCNCDKNDNCTKQICVNIQQENIRQDCLLQAALFTKDETICPLLIGKKIYETTWLQNECVKRVYLPTSPNPTSSRSSRSSSHHSS